MTVTKAMASAPGFAMSELQGSGVSAAATWRSTSPAVNFPAVNFPAVNLAAALDTQIKHYLVTTPDAGRGNKGTSPWGFPV